MGVYRRFQRGDILYTNVQAKPATSVKYGSNGWVGSAGPSASLSLYSGVRSRFDVGPGSTSGVSIYPIDELQDHSIDKVQFVSGSYPSTGSIRFVRCTNENQSIFSQTSTRWYDEHFSPISILFDYYSRIDSNYFIGSHDFYSVLLLGDRATNYAPGTGFVFSGTFVPSATSSWTAEAWVKPLPWTTSSSSPFRNEPTIFSQQNSWDLFIENSGSVSLGIHTGTVGPSSVLVSPAEWNHVAVSVQSGVSASFWINGTFGGTFAFPHIIANPSGTALVVGARSVGSSSFLNSVNGFVFESRLWNRALTGAEIQRFSSGTLFASSSSDLVHYARFNDGPLATAHGFSAGSGALDHSSLSRAGYSFAYANSFVPHWQPNDHESFVFPLSRASGSVDDIRLFHVPSLFYGRQIDPGSVRIVDGTYNSRNIVRVFCDDGRGTLYVSGSMTRRLSGEDYTGNTRRKVGNVFYTEGLVVFTDPSMWDIFDTSSSFWNPTEATLSGTFSDLISLDFRGQTWTNTKVFNCRAHAVEMNTSNNPSYSYRDDRGTVETDDDRTFVLSDGDSVYISAIGMYNEEHRLVAVAKLATPMRKRQKDKLDFRIKLDM